MKMMAPAVVAIFPLFLVDLYFFDGVYSHALLQMVSAIRHG